MTGRRIELLIARWKKQRTLCWAPKGYMNHRTAHVRVDVLLTMTAGPAAILALASPRCVHSSSCHHMLCAFGAAIKCGWITDAAVQQRHFEDDSNARGRMARWQKMLTIAGWLLELSTQHGHATRTPLTSLQCLGTLCHLARHVGRQLACMSRGVASAMLETCGKQWAICHLVFRWTGKWKGAQGPAALHPKRWHLQYSGESKSCYTVATCHLLRGRKISARGAHQGLRLICVAVQVALKADQPHNLQSGKHFLTFSPICSNTRPTTN